MAPASTGSSTSPTSSTAVRRRRRPLVSVISTRVSAVNDPAALTDLTVVAVVPTVFTFVVLVAGRAPVIQTMS